MITPSPSPWRRTARRGGRGGAGEAARLRIEAELNDQIEGGVVLIEGEPGIVVEVPANAAADARTILSEAVDSVEDAPPPSD